MNSFVLPKFFLHFFEIYDCLVSDPDLRDWHIVEVEVLGPPGPAGNQFTVR